MKYISRIIGLLLIVLSLLLGYAAIRLCVSSPSVPAYFVAMILIPVCVAFVIVAIEFMAPRLMSNCKPYFFDNARKIKSRSDSQIGLIVMTHSLSYSWTVTRIRPFPRMPIMREMKIAHSSSACGAGVRCRCRNDAPMSFFDSIG